MRTIRFCICALIAFSVLAFGAVEVWSESILEIGAALLLVWWAFIVLRHSQIEIRWNVLFWPLLVFLGIGAIQLAFKTTAYAFLTRVALLKIAACSILFFLSVQAFQGRRGLRSVVWFLMLFAFAVALFGIVQNFTSNGMLYWLRPLTAGGDFFGPYVNRNHFAGLMELLSPFGLSLLLFRGIRREQMAFVGILTIVPIAALLLSGSRGGIVSFFFEIGILSWIVWNKRSRGRSPFAAIVAGVVILSAFATVGWLGSTRLFDRLTQYHAGELSLERRRTMLMGALRIFIHHPMLGTGLGTLVDVYPKYETYYDGKIVDHAHNDYAEALAETGLAGGLCGLLFLLLFVREARRRLAAEQCSFSLALHAAAVAGCSGILAHSFVDFNLHIPANGLVFLLLVSLAISDALPGEPSRRLGVPLEHTPISSVDIARHSGS